MLVSDQIMKTDLSRVNDSFVSCIDIQTAAPFDFSRPQNHHHNPKSPKNGTWTENLNLCSPGRGGKNLKMQIDLRELPGSNGKNPMMRSLHVKDNSDLKRMSLMNFPSTTLTSPKSRLPSSTTKRKRITGKSISVGLNKMFSDPKVLDMSVLSIEHDKDDRDKIVSVTTQHKNITVEDTFDSEDS